MHIKHIYIALVLAIFMAGLTSCEKSYVTVTTTSPLTIVNAVAGADSLYTNFSPTEAKGTDSFSYTVADIILPYSYQEFGSYTNSVPLNLYLKSDTLTPLFSEKMNLTSGAVYTLFLTGTIAAPESFLTQDQIPVITAPDTAFGIRFVHLSVSSNPVNVYVTEASGDSLIASSLSYKSLTSFIQLPASLTKASYVFKIKDATTTVQLATYTLPVATLSSSTDIFFKSMTLAFYQTATGAKSTLLIHNY